MAEYFYSLKSIFIYGTIYNNRIYIWEITKKNISCFKQGEKMNKELCEGCKESEDTSYDGMCMPCWEDLNEHLEEEM